MDGITQITAEHWNSPRYGGTNEKVSGLTHIMEIVDHRASSGSMLVSISNDNGHVDDVLGAGFEIASLPGSDAPAASMLVYNGDEAVARVFFKRDEGHLIVPLKPGMAISTVKFDDGTIGWMLKS